MAGKLAVAIALLALVVALGGVAVADSGVAGGDLTGTYPNPTIALRKVTGRKIALGAVQANNLATGAVTGGAVADGSLTGTDIADFTIGGTDLASGSVGTRQIAAGAVGLGQTTSVFRYVTVDPPALNGHTCADVTVNPAVLIPGGDVSLVEGYFTPYFVQPEEFESDHNLTLEFCNPTDFAINYATTEARLLSFR